MLQPVVTLTAPRLPQGAEPITFARAHDARHMHRGQPARQAQDLRARREIDEPLEQVPGYGP